MRPINLILVTALGCVSGRCLAAERVSDRVAQAVQAKLPTYDPEIRRRAESERDGREKAAAAATEASPPVATTPPVARADGVVQLEPFVVRQKRSKERALKLPRFEVAAPANPGVDTSDAVLSPEERLRRVRKKWGSPANFFLLNWLFGSSPDVAAEGRAVYAAKIGELAEQIELAAATGATPEEVKQLREYYLQLYTARPK